MHIDTVFVFSWKHAHYRKPGQSECQGCDVQVYRQPPLPRHSLANWYQVAARLVAPVERRHLRHLKEKYSIIHQSCFTILSQL